MEPTARTTRRDAYWALALISLANAASLLDRQVLAILAPSIKADLHLGDAEIGLLYGTVFGLFFALFSLPLGRLADGWKRGRLIALAIAFWSLATAFGGFATGILMLAISRLALGIGQAALGPAGTSMLFDYWPRERRATALAITASAMSLGLGGALVLGGVAVEWWSARFPVGGRPFGLAGWQFALFVAAVPGFILAAATWRLKEPVRGAMDGIATPADPAPFRASWKVIASVTPGLNWLELARRRVDARYWWFNLGALALIVAAMAGLAIGCTWLSPRPPMILGGIAVNPHVLQWSVTGFGLFVIVNMLQNLSLSDGQAYRVMTRSPTLLMVIAAGTLQSIINYGWLSFNPSFVMRNYGLSMGDTALQLGALSVAIGILLPLFWGPFADRLHRRYPGSGRAYLAAACLGVGPLLWVWAYGAPDSTTFFVRFAIVMLALTGWLPPMYAMMYEQVLPRMRGITASLNLLVTTILGMGIGPYVVGVLSDVTGDLRLSLMAIQTVGLPVVILLLLVARRVNRDESALLLRAA